MSLPRWVKQFILKLLIAVASSNYEIMVAILCLVCHFRYRLLAKCL